MPSGPKRPDPARLRRCGGRRQSARNHYNAERRENVEKTNGNTQSPRTISSAPFISARPMFCSGSAWIATARTGDGSDQGTSRRLPQWLVGDTYTITVSGRDTAAAFCVIDMHIPPFDAGFPRTALDFEETVPSCSKANWNHVPRPEVRRAGGRDVNVLSNAPHQSQCVVAPVRPACVCSPAGLDEFSSCRNPRGHPHPLLLPNSMRETAVRLWRGESPCHPSTTEFLRRLRKVTFDCSFGRTGNIPSVPRVSTGPPAKLWRMLASIRSETLTSGSTSIRRGRAGM